jgi:NADH-quinone oxidoreductase subunit M
MTIVSPLGFLVLLLAPLAHAELLRLVRGERRQRLLALSGALAALVCASLVSLHYYANAGRGMVYAQLRLGASAHALHFVVDALNAPLLPLVAALALAIVLGGPLSCLRRHDLRALLWLEALLLITLVTADLAVLILGWVSQILPIYLLRTPSESAPRAAAKRVTWIYHGLAVVCLTGAGVALGYWMQPRGLLDMSLVRPDASAVPERVRPVLFALFSVAALVRMGVTPFHSWLPVAFERGALLPLALLVSTRTGVYVLARLVIPALPESVHAARPALTLLALSSAVYGAIAALGQHDLRRLLAFWVVSQSGIMLTGFAFGSMHAVSGTLLYWIGFALATTGLALVIAALEARTGSSDMRDFGGIVRKLPRLAACFFMLGLATIAVPGTVAFVAEELLVHGALQAHPGLTIFMILAMVLNAIAFVRAFTLTFLGELHPRHIGLGDIQDLLPRERLTAAALVLILVLAGVRPGVLVAAQQAAAEAIALKEPTRAP